MLQKPALLALQGVGPLNMVRNDRRHLFTCHSVTATRAPLVLVTMFMTLRDVFA